jgi:DMSO reductase anchor subunit
MSREILAFAVFAFLAVSYAAVSLLATPASVPRIEDVLEVASPVVGLAGVVCSVLVYHVTRRPWWSAGLTGFKFLMTTIVLGLATMSLSLSAGVALLHDAEAARAVARVSDASVRLLAAATLLKLIGELTSLRHLSDRRLTPLKRSALLMRNDLRSYTLTRFAAGLAGGVALPLLARAGASVTRAAAVFVLLVAGELLERTLFFAAASSPGMPGGLR